MKREHLATYISVQKWFANIVKHGTKSAYLLALDGFVQFTNMNPDKMVTLGMKDSEAVHDLMKMHYQNNELSSKSRMARYQALRSFFRANRIRLDKKPRTFRGIVEYESRKIYDQDEVVALVDAARGFRDKALIACLAQSGQRIGVVVNLPLGYLTLDDAPRW